MAAFNFTWDHIAPMTGMLDDRSSPDLMEAGSWRSRVNLISTDKTTLARMPGFSRYGDNNSDLHDQLIPLCTGTPAIEIPSMLAEVMSTSGNRRLIAATKSRLYALNETTGNWIVLAWGLAGGNSLIHRWTCAAVGDSVVFTNDYDVPMYWALGNFPKTADEEVVLPHPCVEDLNITKVGTVYAWKGFCFFADVEMDGVRYANRILWSNFQDALDFDPGVDGTQASKCDLEYGERILGISELGDYLLFYTNRGIWRATIVSGDEGINFMKAYHSERSYEGILSYRRTLVNLGDVHVYCGIDGVYQFGASMTKPERIDWVYQATATMWSTLSKSACDLHVAGYDSDRRLIYISYAEDSSLVTAPTRTLVLDMKNLTASFMDAGFYCFTSYRPDATLNLRDFLLQYCVCAVNDMTASDGLGFIREGLPATLTAGTCTQAPTSIYRDSTLGLPENTNLEPSVTSLCSILEASGISKIEDFCRMCESDVRFIGVSTIDKCLKELGSVYARDICINAATGTGTTVTLGYRSFTGTYVANGYYSSISTGPIYWDGKIRGVRLYFQADAQAVSAEIVLRVGLSNQPYDPIDDFGTTQILWHEQTINKRYLTAQSDRSGAQHLAAKTLPVDTIYWPLSITGKYVYIELTIKNQNSTAPTAAVARFSRLSLGY